MTFRNRLKDVAIAIAILAACFVIAAVLTILLSPAWLWFEARTGIEAYGHSGPTEWCYMVTYGLLVGICTLVWAKANKTRPTR